MPLKSNFHTVHIILPPKHNKNKLPEEEQFLPCLSTNMHVTDQNKMDVALLTTPELNSQLPYVPPQDKWPDPYANLQVGVTIIFTTKEPEAQEVKRLAQCHTVSMVIVTGDA